MPGISLILFLIIRIFSNPIANALQKKLSDEISPSVINFYTYALLSICYIPYISKYIEPEFINAELILLVLIAGLLCMLGTVCMIKAINIGELSVLRSINSYKSVVGLIIAFVFLKEVPSLYAICGILLIIFGSKIIFDTEKNGFSFNLLKRKDIQLRFLALVLTGTEAVILKKIILLSSVEACFIFWCFTGMLWSLILVLLFKQKLTSDHRTTMLPLMITALCLGFMQYSTNYVFKYMNVGYALALFQLSSIITVFFGCKFFAEKELFKKLAGAVIMLTGSVIIILF